VVGSPVPRPKTVAVERHHTLRCADSNGAHNIHYVEWGDAANPNLLICAHGLTRCARDFDVLAAAMSDRYRVICPDAAGRGESDWLANPADYSYPQYLSDTQALLTHLNAGKLHWVGTSMGGMLGMLLASLPNSPVTRLVLNDVGILVPKEALERIGRYVGQVVRFASFEEAVATVKAISPFGLNDEQWRSTTRPLLKQNDDGSWQFRYDPAIGDIFRQGPIGDVDLTPYWNAVACPVLLLRGEESDLLKKETFKAMCAKAGVQGIEFAGIGHAPMLMSAGQIAAVREFLLA